MAHARRLIPANGPPRVYTRFVNVRRDGLHLYGALDDFLEEVYHRPTPEIERRLAKGQFVEPERIVDLRHFLWENTPHPPVGVYDQQSSRRPRTWLLPTAREHLEAAWEACTLLNANGVPIRPIMSRRVPGRELYRDDVQIVVVPPPGVPKPLKRSVRRAKRGWTGNRTTVRYGNSRHWLNVRTNPARAPE